MESNKVLVYYTGGTIGMKRNSEGRLEPDPEFPQRMAEALRRYPGLPEWEIQMRTPALDSSNMTPKDWVSIAGHIIRNQDNYKSIIVLHGTDTMAYTTSALSFMIEGLRKPVIFTGSQIPLSEPNNDALNNLLNSLRIAAVYTKPHVCLCFGGKLLLGCRSVKVDTKSFVAFDSPNAPPIAVVNEEEIQFSGEDLVLAEEGMEPNVQEFTVTEAGVLRLFPGISGTITENFLKEPIKGVVIQAYGSGNGPTNDDHIHFREALEAANKRGVVLVAISQCLKGSVNVGTYETGLGKYGVISGFDMTVEAALTKLFWLLSKRLQPSEIKEWMQRNLRGELTRQME